MFLCAVQGPYRKNEASPDGGDPGMRQTRQDFLRRLRRSHIADLADHGPGQQTTAVDLLTLVVTALSQPGPVAPRTPAEAAGTLSTPAQGE